MSVPTVIHVDHRRLLREATVDALGGQAVEVVTDVGDVAAAGLQVERLAPDVLVVAFDVPGALDDLVPRVRALSRRPRILVLDESAVASDQRLQAAIEAGADGYVTGRGGVTGLADAIRTLTAGGSVVPPDMLGPLLRGLIDRRRQLSEAFEQLVDLTPREREILLLVADGLDHDAIAERLVIAPTTARTHVHRVFRKLGVGSRAEAIALVRRQGLGDHLERVVDRTAG